MTHEELVAHCNEKHALSASKAVRDSTEFREVLPVLHREMHDRAMAGHMHTRENPY